MATRYPLVVDTTDDNKIKELPSGDNLNLSGNNRVNVVAVTASGTITANSMVVDTSAFYTLLAGTIQKSHLSFIVSTYFKLLIFGSSVSI